MGWHMFEFTNFIPHDMLIENDVPFTNITPSTRVAGLCNFEVFPRYNHIQELLGSYPVFIKVMVFYLFCQRSMRIVVTAIFTHIIYLYIQSFMKYI